MATLVNQDSRYDERQHPVFVSSFDAATRRQLIDEDLSAGRSVSAVLVAIVSLGLLIGIFALLATT